MAQASPIEWTDATWNPIRGCSRISEGCRNCYAERIAARFHQEGQPYHGLAHRIGGKARWTGKVRLVIDNLDEPLFWRRPRRIFVNSMSDLFHEDVPDAWIDRIFATMALAPRHTFQILTKRADRMAQYFQASDRRTKIWMAMADAKDGCGVEPPPAVLPNVWLGVSVEDQAAGDSRIPDLLATPAAVRFLSCEPLLGAIDISAYCWPTCWRWDGKYNSPEDAIAAGAWAERKPQALVAAGRTFIDWVIAGGESGPGARHVHPDWIRGLRDQCGRAKIPFFFKQWGSWLPGEVFHPESERGCWLVYWQDGSEEYNGEDIDFTTEMIGGRAPEGCATAANEEEQRMRGATHINGNESMAAAKSCPREACRAAGYCKGDDKPWLTLARKHNKTKTGRLLDGRTWDEFPKAAS